MSRRARTSGLLGSTAGWRQLTPPGHPHGALRRGRGGALRVRRRNSSVRGVVLLRHRSSPRNPRMRIPLVAGSRRLKQRLVPAALLVVVAAVALPAAAQAGTAEVRDGRLLYTARNAE